MENIQKKQSGNFDKLLRRLQTHKKEKAFYIGAIVMTVISTFITYLLTWYEKIKLVVVGKLKEKFFADACSEYLKRLQRFATVTVTELKDKDGSDEIVKESDDILRAIEGKVFLRI